MKKEIAEKWVDALRNGGFKQGKRRLDSQHGMCCLGVLCFLAQVEGVCEIGIERDHFSYGKEGQTAGLPPEVQSWSGMGDSLGYFKNKKYDALAFLNDEGKSFSELADIIEKHYEEL